MAFMDIETLYDVWYVVETRNGTDYIPESVCGRLPIPDGHTDATEDDCPAEDWESICAMLRDYVGSAEIQEVFASEGWGARYSAPGYLDCTDWMLGDTEAEAVADCKSMYGDDEDGAEDDEDLPVW